MVDRAQKYHRHERVLYALLFKSGQAYIGQTIDAKRRAQEHRRAWAASFEFVQLETMTGTQLEAEDHEFAWRFRAHKAGFSVVAKARGGEPFVVRDTRNRMNAERWAITGRLRWPREVRRRKPWAWVRDWLFWQSAGLAACWLLLRLPMG